MNVILLFLLLFLVRVSQEIEIMTFEPVTICPVCGSSNVNIGSGNQDDPDGESSNCNSCGGSWGGANYWK